MAVSILKLLTGVVESFVGKKPPTEIASILGVEFPELRVALQQTITHTWRGKLTFVLADPQFRPDLVPFYTHLARLEEQYGVLMNQHRRAEQICHEVRADPQGYSLPLLLKAEMFANRIESQCLRVLASIQKTELLLAKAEMGPAEFEKQPDTPAKTATNPAPEPPANIAASAAANVTAEAAPQQNPTEAPPSSLATDHQPLTTPSFPDPEEFKLVILRNRHRIKNTPAKDRPELIARLIEQERTRKQNQSDPNQSGKNAA